MSVHSAPGGSHLPVPVLQMKPPAQVFPEQHGAPKVLQIEAPWHRLATQVRPMLQLLPGLHGWLRPPVEVVDLHLPVVMSQLSVSLQGIVASLQHS